ncbi:MAG: HEAT repeat domain-containing protein [Armatimonadota bacterium]|nr:HEAT repeat domain-containing protein [Armatimonadota bacterium]
MVGERQAEGEDAARFEAARRAIRAVAAAYRTLRLYPLTHRRTAEALEAARAEVDACTAVYGAVGVAPSGRGFLFDFSPQPYEDDVVADLARALRARGVPALRFFPGVTTAELAEVVAALHLPLPQLERSGGLRAYLGERGVRSLVVEPAGLTPAGEADPLQALIDALLEAAAAADPGGIAAVLRRAESDDETVRLLFRRVDRRLMVESRALRRAAWRAIGESLTPPHEAWQVRLGETVVRAADEPWAAALIASWPPLAAPATPARQDEGVRSEGGRPPSSPAGAAAVTAPSPSELAAAAAEFAAWDGRRIREQTVRALGDLLPRADGATLPPALVDLEAAVVEMVREGDTGGILAAIDALAAAASHRQAPEEPVRTMLIRVLSLGATLLLERSADEPSLLSRPFRQAMASAPEETVRALLELSAQDHRLHIRRRAVDLLADLAAGRPELLSPHVLDPRWHVARNAVTVLERVGGRTVPALRAAMGHDDGHVRREALRAAATAGTPEAVEAIAEALRHRDPATRQAAAHWLGVTGRPEAAAALTAVLEDGPLTEQVDLKREVIRALGRIGSPTCASALRRILAATAPPWRRRVLEELKQEARAALARIGGGAG